MLRIKQAREATGLKQKEMAKILNVTAATYSRYENGLIQPDPTMLLKIANALGTSVDYILGRDIDVTKLNNYVELPEETLKVPVIGSVKCGPNGLAFQYLEGNIYVPSDLHGEIVGFRCRGDSMSGLGIQEGDIAIVRRQETVQSGELAVLVINGDEGTLKRVRLQKNAIILEAANPAYPPLLFIGEDMNTVKIVGRVLQVIKNF